MKIAINSKLCLKKRFVKAKCTVCIDICPAKSINEKLEIDNNCINCGLCLSNCPFEAITGVNYPAKSIQQLIAKEEPIKLICQKCQSDSMWPCLGFLDPTLLLAFVFSNKDSNREVIIYQEDCRTCNDNIAQYLTWIVKEANQLLSPDKKRIVNSKKRFSGVAPEGNSRRQFFAQLWGTSVSTVQNLVFPSSEDVHPIPRRNLFMSYGGTQRISSSICNQTTFKTLVVGENCNACGVCSKLCGTGAISSVAEKRGLEIRHKPALCNSCYVCVSQCPQGAISLRPANSLKEDTVGRVKMPVCTVCGKVYQPLGNTRVCLDCMQKTKILSF
ncbi:hypothetical protein SDC9_11455 [bioreactor metagenome]|uniref:4Fe-4S ferredoxin-type domain-containing protein n=1 Tax=bioreactor metagenome TaxID=1076179 RepID=A0A644TJA0_9ZZZZ|nr:4Fe-4S binding protein [Negativicutes bacterium]